MEYSVLYKLVTVETRWLMLTGSRVLVGALAAIHGRWGTAVLRDVFPASDCLRLGDKCCLLPDAAASAGHVALQVLPVTPSSGHTGPCDLPVLDSQSWASKSDSATRRLHALAFGA